MNIINVIGLSSGFIGSLILAFSLSSIVSMLSLVVSAHELNSVSNGEAVVTGLDIHMDKSRKTAGFWTKTGLLFLAVGFALQILAVFMPK